MHSLRHRRRVAMGEHRTEESSIEFFKKKAKEASDLLSEGDQTVVDWCASHQHSYPCVPRRTVAFQLHRQVQRYRMLQLQKTYGRLRERIYNL